MKKKGFTLIELLAVVVILSVLALILVPFVSNIIRQARINAAVVSAYGYVEAANNEIVSKQTKGENVADINYNIENSSVVGGALDVRYEGKGPTNGWFGLQRGKVIEGEFCINGFDIIYENGKASYDKDGDICPSNGNPISHEGVLLADLCDGKKNYETEDEYTIEKVEDLFCLSKMVSYGNTFEEKTINLVSNIDFTGASSYRNANGVSDDFNDDGVTNNILVELTTGNGFIPIGSSLSLTFNGTFNGNNHTISNLKVDRSLQGVGLFGVTDGATITNLILDQTDIEGSFEDEEDPFGVGALIGISVDSTLENITLTNNSVSGVGNVGGMIGIVYGEDASTSLEEITMSNNTIDGSGDNIGGVIGTNDSDGLEITGANLNSNTITGLTDNVGGLIGYNPCNKPGWYGSCQAISNFIGIKSVGNTITGNDNVGGIAGNFYGTLKSIYAKDDVEGNENVGGVVGYLDRVNNSGSIYVEPTVLGVDAVGGVYGYVSNYHQVAVVEEGTVEATNGIAGAVVGKYSSISSSYRSYVSSSVTVTRTVERDSYISNENLAAAEGYKFNSSYNNILLFEGMSYNGFDTIYGMDNDYDGYVFDYAGNQNNKLMLYKVSDIRFSSLQGEGTESNPYILATEADFRSATQVLNGAYYFRIGDNIDISSFNHFYPLGTYNTYFNGYLDGNNKTISNMYISGELYTGFIGYAIDADIKNLTLTGFKTYGTDFITGTDYNGNTGYIGCFIGNGEDVVLTNITINDSQIESFNASTIGVLAGELYGGSGTNINVDIHGKTIKGYSNIGGVAGYLEGNFIFNNININSLRIESDFGQVGGIFVHGYGTTLGDITASNVTIAGNNRTYNGGGHEIGGLFYNISDITYNTITANNITITGCVSTCGGVVSNTGANIHDVVANNVTILGTGDYVGGIAGTMYGGITNSFVNNVNVEGTNYVGGVAGKIEALKNGNENIFKNLSITGNVKGTTGVGGIAGRQIISIKGMYYKSAKITDFVINANITGSDYVAGVIGLTYSGAPDISGSQIRGVIQGGKIKATNGLASVVDNSCVDLSSDTNPISPSTIMVFASNGIEFATTSGVNNCSGVITNSAIKPIFYDASNTFDRIMLFDDAIDTWIGGDNDNDGYYFDYESNNSNNVVLLKKNANTFTTHFTAAGTASNPIILTTEQDFKEAALLLNQSKWFALNSNINFNDFNHFYGLGTFNNPFTGGFNGNNHTISNMKIYVGLYGGFIGSLTGTVKNVNFANPSLKLERKYFTNRLIDYMYSGTVVGYVSANSVVENINVNGITMDNSVSLPNGHPNLGDDSQFIGGVVGRNYGTVQGVNVSNLNIVFDYSSTYRTKAYVGGVVGINNNIIIDVSARGSITAESGGGIAYLNDANGKIEYTVANVNVLARIESGGIVGRANAGSLYARGIVEGGTLTSTEYSRSGHVVGDDLRPNSTINSYPSGFAVAYSVTKQGSGDSSPVHCNLNNYGCFSTSDVGDLSIYNGFVTNEFASTTKIFDSVGNGDLDGNGFYFVLDSNGLAKAVRIGQTPYVFSSSIIPITDGGKFIGSSNPLEDTNALY